MKQAPDAIYIITKTTARADEIKRAIALRGFDEIVCVPFESAGRLLRTNPPALAIIDAEGDDARVGVLLREVPNPVKNLVLAEAFEEALFVTCHDKGMRDYMIKPVPDAYLVSRVIRTLQEHRMEQLISQKDRVLVEMGVLSARSGVFTTSYLLKQLKQYSEAVSPYAPDPLSLLIIQLEGYTSPLPEELQNILMAEVGTILRECARGLDAVGEYFMDKFAIVLPYTGRRGSKALAHRLIERLHGLEFQGANGQFKLEVRIGMAEYAGCRHYEDLLNKTLANLNGTEYKPEEASGGKSFHQV